MATGVAICNLALIRVGQTPIESTAEPPSLSGSDKSSVALNALWEPKRDALLRLFPWPFASRRVRLNYTDGLVTVTGATQANPVVVTAPAHGFADGQGVVFEDVGGMVELNGRQCVVDNAATNTFELWNVDGTGFSPYGSGGTVRMKPAYGFEYELALPGACLEVQDAYGSWAWEYDHLLTDEPYPAVKYTARVTDGTLFSAPFVNALYLFLAIELAQYLADSKDLKAQVSHEFGEVLHQARFMEALAARSPEDADDRELTSWQSAGGMAL